MVYTSDNMSNLYSQIQIDLDRIKFWFCSNKLVLSEKTKYVIFNLKRRFFEKQNVYYRCLTCDSKKTCNICFKIEQVNFIKYLGIILDENFTWKLHVDKLKMEMISILRKFFILRYLCPIKVVRSVYCALVESRLQYGISCWGGAYMSNINPLQIAQKNRKSDI